MPTVSKIFNDHLAWELASSRLNHRHFTEFGIHILLCLFSCCLVLKASALDLLLSVHPTRISDAGQEEMEVNETGVRLPLGHGPTDPLIIQWLSPAQEARQIVPCSNIIARKNIQAAEASEQDVFRCPSADAREGPE
jgi:hypothetical protein